VLKTIPSGRLRLLKGSPMTQTATLLVTCPDQKGLVAKISDFIFRHGGNLLDADQHTDVEVGVFLARMEWDLAEFNIPRHEIAGQFKPLAEAHQMQFQLFFNDDLPKMAILVSKMPHCLWDLILRRQAGEFRAEIALVASNHSDAGIIARQFEIPFLHFPITPENKRAQEDAIIQELRRREIDLVVLARYMQILSPAFVDAFPQRIINIHHSFLPAFIGAQPYHQAYTRGVKIIGASSHYVTAELDNGPIIEQEIVRVTHRDSIDDLIRKGRDLEKMVLGRAVRLHLKHQVLTYHNKTVVFD
jgi:formyltetrahydrofolate deformylase